jgi:hypothetical protein
MSEVVSFDFFNIVVEILETSTQNEKARRMLRKMKTVEEARDIENYAKLVTWSGIWDGIKKQVEADINRCCIHFRGQRYVHFGLLFYDMKKHMKSYAPLVMAFLNQAAMFDVATYLYHETQRVYGENAIVCEGSHTIDDLTRDSFSLFVHVKKKKDNAIQIKYEKCFKLMMLDSNGDPRQSGVISTVYRICVVPEQSAVLSWSVTENE